LTDRLRWTNNVREMLSDIMI